MTDNSPADDFTLDELALLLAPAVADAAAFDGWSEAAIETAADACKVDRDVARLAFPGGAMDMIAAWIATIDASMEAALPPEKLGKMKVREKIAALVLARLDAIAGKEESLRRAMAIMAMPQSALRATRLGWNSADRMWRMAGDTATDYNHYTKRAILGSIYAATLAVFVNDESEGKADTRAFLDRRIEGVMRFEKAKARLLKGDDERFSPARFLGRLRYPAK
ncbi:COQ9 family protein [Tsuneonella mangrovi]|uniref:COQ9 family protein n=1 Tax=Tsuneonella mangrovi TaxID=1982042 RepID=UPI000BA23ED2|nr:COQ9 family protein [Tsuneonella mangrovi]